MQRVLIGCPTYDGQSYCIQRFLEQLKLVKGPHDALFIDNSESDTHSQTIAAAGFEVVRNVNAGADRIAKIISNRQKIIDNLLEKKYNYLLFLDTDIIPPEADGSPGVIITGGTAYPRDIDYARVRQIADSVGALYLADIAHEAGLIAAGVLPSPVGIADAVTLTTHKTLRAGRGAIILAPTGAIKKINRAIMPGLQGGPHNHNIAGICVGLGEVLQPVFAAYARQIVANAQALAAALSAQRFTLVAGGTDKHLLLLDLTHEPLLGKKFARALDAAGLVANANSMPQETRSPVDPSALRVGTPWVTTRGMREGEMQQIAAWLREVMTIASSWAADDFAVFNARAAASRELAAIAGQVRELCVAFPLVLRDKPSILAVLRR